MQPRSIKLFTILFFVANAVSLIGEYAFFDRFLSEMMLDPEVEWPSNSEEVMTSFMLGVYVTFFGLILLLWFFVAERRSKIAKWILVVLTALFAASYFAPGEDYMLDEMAVYGVTDILMVAAVAMLFRNDARKWFDRVEDIDPEVFN